MQTWTALDLPEFHTTLLDGGGKYGIFSATLARLTLLPGRIATLGNLKRVAQHPNRVRVTVLCNERKAVSAGCARRCPALFLACRAPSAAAHAHAGSDASPPRAAVDAHCPEKPAPRASANCLRHRQSARIGKTQITGNLPQGFVTRLGSFHRFQLEFPREAALSSWSWSCPFLWKSSPSSFPSPFFWIKTKLARPRVGEKIANSGGSRIKRKRR